jgi:hypothetical protein
MPLSEIDRNLLERCLDRKSRAWEDFVDRFVGLLVHVVNETAQARGVRLTDADRDHLCADVFLNFLRNDFAVLRQFRGRCSLASYLTVVSRRIVDRKIAQGRTTASLSSSTLKRSTRSVMIGGPGPGKKPQLRPVRSEGAQVASAANRAGKAALTDNAM